MSEPSKVVRWNLACSRCGYNLRTLSREGRCPECNTAVRESIERDRINRIPSASRGVRTPTIAGLILVGVTWVAYLALISLRGANRSAGPALAALHAVCLALQPVVAFWLGTCIGIALTRPKVQRIWDRLMTWSVATFCGCLLTILYFWNEF